MPSDAFQILNGLPWGQVNPIGELPAPLPPPPSSKKWWVFTSLVAIIAITLSGFVFGPSFREVGAYPLQATFQADHPFQWLEFDVAEEAIITVVSQEQGQLVLLNRTNDAADKAQFAVGDGSFRLRTQGEALLLVSTNRTIDDLKLHIEEAQISKTPLESLASRIKTSIPKSDIRIFHP
jgi:hypothetical protein